MKWWHWLLIIVAAGILAGQARVSGDPNLSGQLAWVLGLELAYFVVLGVLGTAFGRIMQARLLQRDDREEYRASVPRYQMLSLLFLIAAVSYLLTGWIPGAIGRHIIFFAGYYWGLSRKRGD